MGLGTVSPHATPTALRLHATKRATRGLGRTYWPQASRWRMGDATRRTGRRWGIQPRGAPWSLYRTYRIPLTVHIVYHKTEHAPRHERERREYRVYAGPSESQLPEHATRHAWHNAWQLAKSVPDRPRLPPSPAVPKRPRVEHPARARPSLPIPELAVSRRRRLVSVHETRARAARTSSHPPSPLSRGPFRDPHRAIIAIPA